jgi:hypothetical protein
LVQYLSGIPKVRGLEWPSIFVRVSGRDDAQQGASLFKLGFDFNSEFEHRFFQMESIDDASPTVFAHLLFSIKRPLDRHLQRFLEAFCVPYLAGKRLTFGVRLNTAGGNDSAGTAGPARRFGSNRPASRGSGHGVERSLLKLGQATAAVGTYPSLFSEAP